MAAQQAGSPSEKAPKTSLRKPLEQLVATWRAQWAAAKDQGLVVEPTYNCPTCRDRRWVGPWPDGPVRPCPDCLVPDLARVRLRHLFEAVESARVPSEYRGRSLSDLQQFQHQSKAVEVATRYLADWDRLRVEGAGLGFFGPPGTGKTALLHAVAETLRRRHVVAVVVQTPGLLAEIVAAISSGRDVQEAVKRLTEADWLALTDLGAEKATEFATVTLYRIIDGRRANRRPTAFDTNLSAKELRIHLGDRTWSRLAGGCRGRLVVLEGPDLRLTEGL